AECLDVFLALALEEATQHQGGHEVVGVATGELATAHDLLGISPPDTFLFQSATTLIGFLLAQVQLAVLHRQAALLVVALVGGLGGIEAIIEAAVTAPGEVFTTAEQRTATQVGIVDRVLSGRIASS